MTYVAAPLVRVAHPTTVETYAVEDRFYVTISDGSTMVLTFVGGLEDLHALFLGLHNVLVTGAEAEDHEAKLVIDPVRLPLTDA